MPLIVTQKRRKLGEQLLLNELLIILGVESKLSTSLANISVVIRSFLTFGFAKCRCSPNNVARTKGNTAIEAGPQID